MKLIVATLLILLQFLAAPPLEGQEDREDRTRQDLLRTQEAILNELRSIRKLLEARADLPPSQQAAGRVEVTGNPRKGSPSAKVALLEFSEFECPFCARHAANVYPLIAKEFVENGNVQYIWLDLPLDRHRFARKAALAGRCAEEQGRFWEMHDQMFANQKRLDTEHLLTYAESVGLNSGAFKDCLASDRFAARIDEDLRKARAVGVTATPSFLIGLVQPDGSIEITSRIIGAKPIEEFRNELNTALRAVAVRSP